MQCFSFSFLNTNHNLNYFFHASLSTLKWHIGGTKFTNLSLSCAQSCVTTYWYHAWHFWWLVIIYAWLSTAQKQVGKILILPKSTHFPALCSVNRANIHESNGYCYGMSKETFAYLKLLISTHMRSRSRTTVLHHYLDYFYCK